MKSAEYPFAAIVGQPELKLALLLAAVDWRLSVLLQGDKGSGKSTAARGLAEILPASAPFVNLPIGATEDRLLGGLHLDRALQGEARLQSGLIHEAHGGVLYIDEVNLLLDALTDALLDVASSGYYYMERDGFSSSGEARFILLGSMNREEGGLRPQLLDRFALALEVTAPTIAEERVRIVAERLRFDRDPATFRAGWEEEQQRLRQAILDARARVSGMQPAPEILAAISGEIAAAGVQSLRADLAALRAAIAHAALAGRSQVAEEDVAAVLPLVLLHRRKLHSGEPSRPPAPSRDPATAKPEETPAAAKDHVFPSSPNIAPELKVALADSMARGRSADVKNPQAPATSWPRPAADGDGLDVAASFVGSFRKTGVARLQRDHLAFRAVKPRSGLRWIFVVDASGSHAILQRMQAVKGAVGAVLASSVEARDEVAVIAFRGVRAQVVLDPCRDIETALRALEFLPTGGRTPLAHGLELAGSFVTPASVLILLTDGRANVALDAGDPWNDALQAARKLRCPSVLVDSSIGDGDRRAMLELASALGGPCIRLDDFDETALLTIAKNLSSGEKEGVSAM